jgi:hypothetical protein
MVPNELAASLVISGPLSLKIVFTVINSWR